MAFVLLPCDLPCWPAITRLLHSLSGASTPGQVGHVLRALHALTDVSLDPDPPESSAGGGVEGVVGAVEDFLRREGEALEVWGVALPSLVSAALALKDLKPPHGLTYSLQQQGGDVVVARRLAASLLAHMFLGTLPRRSPLTHPTLTDPSLAPTLAALHRESQKVKMRSFFRYFKMLTKEKCEGEVTFSRKVMTGRQWVRLQEWVGSETPLCGVEVRREGGVTSGPPHPSFITAFTTPDPARPALIPITSQAASVLQSSPEVVVAAVLVERLEDNEALQVTGALTPAPHGQAGLWRGVTHVLMDADDYRASDILQYEEVNVLRELNKARLGFSQDLPPPPSAPVQTPAQFTAKVPAAASSSSRSSEIISVSRQESVGSGSTGLKVPDSHLSNEGGRRGMQTRDSTKTDDKGKTDKRVTGDDDKGIKSEDKETTTEKGNESLKDTTKNVKESDTTLKEGVTQGEKEEGRRGGSESYCDTTESELRSEQASSRRRKTSITQRIKGMLRKGDAKAKEKEKEKEKGEAGEGGGSRKGLSFRYKRGKSKGRKEGSAVSSKAEMEDESVAKGKDSAGRKKSQQDAGQQQKSADKQGKDETQQEKSGSGKHGKESTGEQEGSLASASDRQRAGWQDTKAATPPHKPGGGATDGAKSAPEPSTPAGTRSPSAALQQQESAGSSYVTANSTLRRSSRKPRLTRTKRLEAFPSACDPGSPKSPGQREVKSPPDTSPRSPPQREVRSPADTSRGSRGIGDSKEEEEEDDDEDETTRLLNRVLRAIQILEKERPDLVEEAAKEEEKERQEEEAQRSPDRPRTLARMKGRRPPTPRPLRHEIRGRGGGGGGTRMEEGEWRKMTGRDERAGGGVGRGRGRGETSELGERRKNMLGSEGLRSLSQYYSCSEDLPPSSPPSCPSPSTPPSRPSPLSPPSHKPSPFTLPQGRPTVSPLGPSHPRSPPLSPLNRSHPRTPPVSPRTPPVSSFSASHPRSPPLSPLNRMHPRAPPLSPLALPRLQASEDEPYYSACESLDDEKVASPARPRKSSRKRGRKSARKSSFAERLKEAIAREPSKDSQHDAPLRPRMNRQESAGFVLDHNLPQSFSKEKEEGEEEEDEEEEEEEDESSDEEDDEEGGGKKQEKTCSSRYSFSSDYTSELDEVYEELGAALEGLEGNEPQGPRAAALTRLAKGILKRGLSESFKDVPLGLDGSTLRGSPQAGGEKLLPRSLSLSGHHPQHASAPHAPPAAPHDSKVRRGKPVVTGNWGCGSLKGDPQLKAMLQWAAASQAGAPRLIYCTYGEPQLVKLDTVARLVGDRGWTVGQLVATVLRHCEARLRRGAAAATLEAELTESADSSLPEAYRYRTRQESISLFDDLIGRERPHGGLKTEL